ncbi:MAG: lipoate--protein ligase family protein [Spirochaetes bacterium]|nr:lipoate--protein ligase family protein [Spirochaetota bacterium]
MDRWRLIVDGPLQGSRNMAVDYAILREVAAGGTPTFRLYRWYPPAVTIGYFQVREDETDAVACAAEGIPVIRRITGGGAVFHDHEITYSLAVPLEDRRVAGTVADSYRIIVGPLIGLLGDMGIDAAFRPINDITVEGRKISGSAQTRREGVLLQHGTLLLSVDYDRMFRYLAVPAVKSSGRNHASPRQAITALDQWISDDVSDRSFLDELTGRMADAYAESLGVVMSPGGLTAREEEQSLSIEEELFLNGHWNDKRKK